jgi:hypothetical protein
MHLSCLYIVILRRSRRIQQNFKIRKTVRVINNVLKHLWYKDTLDYAFIKLRPDQSYDKEVKYGQ